MVARVSSPARSAWRWDALAVNIVEVARIPYFRAMSSLLEQTYQRVSSCTLGGGQAYKYYLAAIM